MPSDLHTWINTALGAVGTASAGYLWWATRPFRPLYVELSIFIDDDPDVTMTVTAMNVSDAPLSIRFVKLDNPLDGEIVVDFEGERMEGHAGDWVSTFVSIPPHEKREFDIILVDFEELFVSKPCMSFLFMWHEGERLLVWEGWP